MLPVHNYRLLDAVLNVARERCLSFVCVYRLPTKLTPPHERTERPGGNVWQEVAGASVLKARKMAFSPPPNARDTDETKSSGEVDDRI